MDPFFFFVCYVKRLSAHREFCLVLLRRCFCVVLAVVTHNPLHRGEGIAMFMFLHVFLIVVWERELGAQALGGLVQWWRFWGVRFLTQFGLSGLP